MTSRPDDPLLTGYLDFLKGEGRTQALGDNTLVLRQYIALLARRGHLPTTATTDDVDAFRAFLTTPAVSVDGGGLALTTQATRLGMVRAFHRWLKRRGHAIANPAQNVQLPRIDKRRVRKDFLTMQEAKACLDTAASAVEAAKRGSKTWAAAMRDLSMLALSIASGVRRSELRHLRLDHLNVERRFLRVERGKGRAGRDNPVADWAVSITVAYRDEARPIILGDRTSPWLFVGQRGEHVGGRTWDATVDRFHRATCAACPDLTDLPGKNISTHSLRVTTARLLFLGGCGIRVINEILRHRRLKTTAGYTPLDLEDMRRAVMAAHPRA